MAVSYNHMIIIFVVILFTTKLIVLVNGSFANGEDSKEVCHEREKEALLSFKQGLVDPSDRLSSWIPEEDCCKWAGIICDNITGHVMELHLSNIPRKYDDRTRLKGKLNPSLLSLKHLSYLDLSYNDFGGVQIPNFIGSLVSLRYLNLSRAGFSGMVPDKLGNLSSLHHLGLGDYDYPMYANNLGWIYRLSSLEYLDMSGVDLHEVFDWSLPFNKLPCLSELRLSECNLGSNLQRPSLVNFTSLSILDLSSNGLFFYSLPNWIFNLSSLVHLGLADNTFLGPFPYISWISPSLRSLDLSANHIHSTIPDSFYGSNLENLNLASNDFRGVLSSAIGNLTSIVSLDLSSNALEGKIPPAIGNLCNFEAISLYGNKYINGDVSEVFEALSSGCVSDRLKSLDLGGNYVVTGGKQRLHLLRLDILLCKVRIVITCISSNNLLEQICANGQVAIFCLLDYSLF